MATALTSMTRLAARCLDLVYPRDCVVTGRPVEPDSPTRYLSAAGRSELFLINDPACPTCGAPIFGEVLASRVCPHCRELEPAFNQGRALFLAKDAGRELIHLLKYQKGRYLLPDIAFLAKSHQRFSDYLNDSIIVPVPLHTKRLRDRGYNQSLLIAKFIFANAKNIET
ncbi:MAG: double zinc ribbon domain-containing protein, partial [Verrucomicrobiota bacterium]